MSSSGSEQAPAFSDGWTQNPFSRIACSAWSNIASLRLNLGRLVTSSYSHRHRRLRKVGLWSLQVRSERSERANPEVAATQKSQDSFPGQTGSLLRGARFPPRRYLRINLFHGELIQPVLLRAFPGSLEPLRDEGEVVARILISSFSAMEHPSRLFDGHLLIGREVFGLECHTRS
jgi:hypothetical protein